MNLRCRCLPKPANEDWSNGFLKASWNDNRAHLYFRNTFNLHRYQTFAFLRFSLGEHPCSAVNNLFITLMYFSRKLCFSLIYIFSHRTLSFKWKLTLSPLEKSPLPSWSRTAWPANHSLILFPIIGASHASVRIVQFAKQTFWFESFRLRVPPAVCEYVIY